jgi:hypothetical protein
MSENDAFRYFAYCGLAFWLVLLFTFIKWRYRDVNYYEKSNQKLLDEGQKDILASRLAFAEKSQKIFKYILYGFGCIIIFICFLIYDEILIGSARSKIFIVENLMLVCLFVPAYFGIMLCVSSFSDMARVIKKIK